MSATPPEPDNPDRDPTRHPDRDPDRGTDHGTDPATDEQAGGLAGLYRARMRRTQDLMSAWVGDLRPPRRHFRSDIVAGLPGAISSVPDGMAASVLAGVNPAHGLYASFAGPIAGGLTSSTRLMVITTTSAAALAAGSVIAPFKGQERSDAMLWLTLMVGAVMLAAAFANLSRFIRFVSYSVMLGFLTGVAVNMVLGQLPDLLGYDATGTQPVMKAWDTLVHLDQADVPTTLAGTAALVVLIALARTRAAIISSLVALALPTLAVLLIDPDGVALVQDTGRIPAGLPAPGIPDPAAFDFSLLTGSVAVAALMLVQGAGVTQAVPNPDGSPSSARRDFTAQGLANTASGLFGGQPVGGSVGQTALNLTAGARTRWAAIWSGLWMALILLALSGVVGQVAMPTLAAVLIYAGWGAISPAEVSAVARAGPIAAVAMVATFAAVLVLPVAVAVGVGVIASLMLQLNQESLDLRLVRLSPDDEGRFTEGPVPDAVRAGDLVVLNAYGSMFYAGAHTLQRLLPTPTPAPTAGQTKAAAPGSGEKDAVGAVVVLRLRGRTTLGATFLKVVGDYARDLEANGGQLYLTGLDPDLVKRWHASGVEDELRGVAFYPATTVLGESTSAAILAAEETHRVTGAPRRPKP